MKAEKLYEGIGYMDEKWIDLLSEPVNADPKRQRHFVSYELKKLFGVRYIWVFLFVLLMLNSVVAWYSASTSAAAKEPTHLISDFFEKYQNDPDELDLYYEKIKAFNDNQQDLYEQAMSQGMPDYQKEVMPNLYSDVEGYSDTELFNKLYEAVKTADEYPMRLEEVIDRAFANLDALTDMGVTEDSFTYRYQLRVIDLYELMRDNVKIDVEYVRGWSEYFSYDIVNVFIFIMLILPCSIIFTSEKQTGFMPVMRTTKNGRGRTATAKLIAVFILTAVFTLMFTITTFAVYGIRLGFSSPYCAIQSLSGFTFSPYQITVGEYFILDLGVKVLVFSAFSALISMLSVVLYNYILIYLSGLGVVGVSFLLHSTEQLNANSILGNLNPITVTACEPLFLRYRAADLFGSVVGFVPIMCWLFPVIATMCTAFTVVLYVRGLNGVRVGWLDIIISGCVKTANKIRLRCSKFFTRSSERPRKYNRSLIYAEVFKTLISTRFIIIVLLILFAKILYSDSFNSPNISYRDTVYREYMTMLSGEITEEKLDYIANERTVIDGILERETMMREAYQRGEIDLDEYSEYLSDFNYAYSRTDVLAEIERHAEYLVFSEAKNGTKGWFIYDTGWKQMYMGDADLFLYTSILLLLSGSFAAEYLSKSSSGSFAQLLRSTKNGRHRTFYAKMISAVIISVLLTLIMGAVDVAVISRGYELPSADAPLMSIEAFAESPGNITVTGYFFLFFSLRMIGAVILALLVCALSQLLARYIPVLGTVVILTLLPMLFAYFGFAFAEKINFLNLLAGTPIFLQSTNMSLFGSGYAMLVLWLTVAVLAVFAMIIPAKRTFVK